MYSYVRYKIKHVLYNIKPYVRYKIKRVLYNIKPYVRYKIKHVLYNIKRRTARRRLLWRGTIHSHDALSMTCSCPTPEPFGYAGFLLGDKSPSFLPSLPPSPSAPTRIPKTGHHRTGNQAGLGGLHACDLSQPFTPRYYTLTSAPTPIAVKSLIRDVPALPMLLAHLHAPSSFILNMGGGVFPSEHKRSVQHMAAMEPQRRQRPSRLERFLFSPSEKPWIMHEKMALEDARTRQNCTVTEPLPERCVPFLAFKVCPRSPANPFRTCPALGLPIGPHFPHTGRHGPQRRYRKGP
ncbi:hypothetical protein P4O66_003350 [Electrophorus voltai]|uniref:Uncharacterized protein n=1 Tax=Electrophorus voltai TaxID=2609070 RepID=A0AAD8YRF5_9TELE|nr:hypothetical protein P4O66_003350 [Electrophorus voltai]